MLTHVGFADVSGEWPAATTASSAMEAKSVSVCKNVEATRPRKWRSGQLLPVLCGEGKGLRCLLERGVEALRGSDDTGTSGKEIP